MLHDFDYEKFPDVAENGHPNTGATILRDKGYDDVIVRGILSHATEVTGVQRESLMEKSLYAVDEVTGLIQAVALVRPSKNLADVKIRSIKKKWKDKRFAAGVHREEVEAGAADLGVELWETCRPCPASHAEYRRRIRRRRQPGVKLMAAHTCPFTRR